MILSHPMANPGLPVVTPPFTLPELGKLAREMAIDIRDKAAILSDYNLTQADYDVICTIPTYAKLLSAFVKEWNSVGSVQDRIKIQSAYALEDGLPSLATRLSNTNEPLSGAVETGKLLAKLAGVGEGAASGPKGEKFTINISLGDRQITFENQTRPIQSVAEGAGEMAEILSITEGSSVKPELHAIPEESSIALPVQPLPEATGNQETVRREEEE